MTSADFHLSSNGGTTYLGTNVALADATALAYASSSTYSIKARLDSTAGVGTVQWTITSADDNHIGALPVVTSNSDLTCSFSVPRTGGAWLLQALVNNGLDGTPGQAGQQINPTYRRALKIAVLNSANNQEIAVGETIEAGANGYTKALNTMGRAGGSGILVGDCTGALSSTTVAAIRGILVNVAAPTDGQVLTYVNAATDIEWKTPTGGGGAPTGAAGGDLSATYPNPTVAKVNGSAIPAGGALVTGNAPYASGVSALTYSALNLAGGAGWVTGLLPLGNQAAPTGTGIPHVVLGVVNAAASAVTSGDVDATVLIASGANALTGNLAAGGFKLLNLGAPTLATDAATKAYVDAVALGLTPKQAVKAKNNGALAGAYTYANGAAGVGATLTSNVNGAFPAQDSVTLLLNDRYLLSAGSPGYIAGIYTLTQAGNAGAPWILTRSADGNTAAELAGAFLIVEDGATFSGTGWVCSTDPSTITIGTTAIPFTQFGNVNAGAGLTQVGSTLSVTDGTTTQVYQGGGGGGPAWTSTPSVVSLSASANLYTGAGVRAPAASPFIVAPGANVALGGLSGAQTIVTTSLEFPFFSLTGSPAGDVQLSIVSPVRGVRYKIFNACPLPHAVLVTIGQCWLPPGMETEVWHDGAAWQYGGGQGQHVFLNNGVLTLPIAGGATAATGAATWKIPAKWRFTYAAEKYVTAGVGGGTIGTGITTSATFAFSDLATTTGVTLVLNDASENNGDNAGVGLKAQLAKGASYAPNLNAATTVYIGYQTSAAVTTAYVLDCSISAICLP